jgi:hypothetical protein
MVRLGTAVSMLRARDPRSGPPSLCSTTLASLRSRSRANESASSCELQALPPSSAGVKRCSHSPARQYVLPLWATPHRIRRDRLVRPASDHANASFHRRIRHCSCAEWRGTTCSEVRCIMAATGLRCSPPLSFGQNSSRGGYAVPRSAARAPRWNGWRLPRFAASAVPARTRAAADERGAFRLRRDGEPAA